MKTALIAEGMRAGIRLGVVAALEARGFSQGRDRLIRKLPVLRPDKSGELGGIARMFPKGFFGGALYDDRLSRSFRLRRVEPRPEDPVDATLARLLAESEFAGLRRWRPSASSPPPRIAFQQVARPFAARKGIERVNMELLHWSEMDGWLTGVPDPPHRGADRARPRSRRVTRRAEAELVRGWTAD